MSGRFDDLVVSSRAPSRLIEVDSTLGGSMGRNVSLDGGGGRLTCCVRGTFPDGSGNPIVVGADCGVRGRFFSTGSCELAILATQWHAHVKPPCHCVAHAVRS
jgi:hypothetical protein